MLDVVSTKDNIAENSSKAERVNETRCEINPNIYNLDMANSTSCETHHTPSIETPSYGSIIHANNNENSTSNGCTDENKKKENNVESTTRRIKLDRSFAFDSKCISRKRRWKTSCSSISLKNKTEHNENIHPLNENRTVDIVKQQNHSENYLEQYHSENNLSNEESKNENSDNKNVLHQQKERTLQENSQIEGENLNISYFNKLPNKRRKEDENESIVYRLKSFTPVISTNKEVKFPIYLSLLRNEAELLPFHEFETKKNEEPTMPLRETFLSNLPEQNMTPLDYPTNQKDLEENWCNKAESDFHDFEVPLSLEKNLKFKSKAQIDSNPKHLSLPIATDNVENKTKGTKVNDDDWESSSSSDDIISLYASSLLSLYEDKIDQQQIQSSKKLSTPADIDQKQRKITFENSQGPSKYPKDGWKQSPNSCEIFLDNMEVKKARRKLTLLPLAESEATFNNTVKHILFPHPCCYSYVLDCCSRAMCGFVHNLPDLHLVKQNMLKCTPHEVTGCYNLVRKTFKAFHFYFSVFFDLYDASDNENMLLHMALDAIKFFQNRSYLDILVFRFRRHYTLPEILDFFNKSCVIQNCRVFEYILLSLKEESLLLSNVLLLKAFKKNSYFKSSSTIEILTNECFQTKDTEFINEVNEILSEMDAKLLLSNVSHVKNFLELVQTTKCISPFKILFKLSFIEDETKSTDFDEQNKSYNTKTYNSGAVRAGIYKSPNYINNNYKFKTSNKINEKNFKYHNGRYSRPYYHNTWYDKTNRRENRIERSENLNVEHDDVPATSNCNIDLRNNDSAKLSDEKLFLRRHQIKDLNNFRKLNLQRNVITNNAESEHASFTLQANWERHHTKKPLEHMYISKMQTEKQSHSHWHHKWKPNKLFSDEALNIKRSQENRPLPQNIETDTNCLIPEKDPLDIEQISAKFSDSDVSNNSEANLNLH